MKLPFIIHLIYPSMKPCPRCFGLPLIAFAFLFFLGCQADPSRTQGSGDDEGITTQSPDGISLLKERLDKCPPCSLQNACDLACTDALRECHSISAATFGSRIFSPTGGRTAYSTQAELCQVVRGADCHNQVIHVIWETTTGGEEAVSLEFHPLSERFIRVSYPVGLFLGLCDLNPENLYFYRGKRTGQAGEEDILIEAKLMDGTSLYYDLSDTVPSTTAGNAEDLSFP